MRGDITGVDEAAVVTKELKSSGLTLVIVELVDDDEDGGVQFWSILESLPLGERAGELLVLF